MPSKNPKYGEIWLVCFEPQVGIEIKKTRPAIIISIDELSSLPIRTVIPIKDYKPNYEGFFSLIPIQPNKLNGLDKDSTIDCLQLKSFDIKRFEKKLGKVSKEEIEEILLVIIRCLGYKPSI